MLRPGCLAWGILLAGGLVLVALPSQVAAQENAVDDAAADGAAIDGAAIDGAEAAPAEAPPAQPRSVDKWNDQHSIPRSDRSFVNPWKLLSLVILVIVWVRSVDWVNRDSQLNDMGYGTWNPIVSLPVLALLLLLVLPIVLPLPANFVIGFSTLVVTYLATFFTYVIIRNKQSEPHERVFTLSWFRYELAQLGSKVGLKIEAERKADYEKGPPVELSAFGAKDDRDNQANLISARQSPGFVFLKQLVADMIAQRSDRVMLDYTQQSVVERHHVDGVWHNGEARDRESGDVMLAVMKTLANLDMTERRQKQAGQFVAVHEKIGYMCPIVSQGVKTGERVVVDLKGGHQDKLETYSDLGMRGKSAEKWSNFMARDQGLLVLSSMPEGGLTTLTDVALMETDRLLRDFVSIEDEHHREREIENIEVTTFNSTAGETTHTHLQTLIRKYPNVYVARDLGNPETVKMLFDEIRDDHLVITNVHAKDAPEALLRMLQKKVPQRDFAALVTAVLNTRLVRKLCEACRVAYEPSPDLLKKLGIPAGKVDLLYRAPKGEELDKPCRECAGISYIGRTGLFELLEVNDKIREILVKQPKLDLLRKAARAAGMRTHQEEGILLVARGVTSLQELQRVLKQ